MPDRQTPRKNDEIALLFQDHQAEQLVQLVTAQIEYPQQQSVAEAQGQLQLGLTERRHTRGRRQMDHHQGARAGMSQIGRGLFDLLSEAGDVFSHGTAIGVSIQLLHALKTLHSIGYLHLDVKPENAAIGRAETKERGRIFLIDFGLARRYIRNDGRARRQRKKTLFRGTPMYASIAAHARDDYSRTSDIESWFYTLVDMYTGKLPWTHVTSEHWIGKMKRLRLSHKPKEVQQRALHALLKKCPPMFYDILLHIDDLDFLDRPNYEDIELALRNYLNTTKHP
ncbi:hypothetical protein niasHT_024521 [Heterodera trifolii]|uniref:Protein kinase domain-containing protein n=1 Tax=Heterodera trifolii TaxID=157864 RepID=A0ABD2K799_9BILA